MPASKAPPKSQRPEPDDPIMGPADLNGGVYVNGAAAPDDESDALALDRGEAEEHLRLLDPEADSFIFVALDDNKERAKETARIRKAVEKNELPAKALQDRVQPDQFVGTLEAAWRWIQRKQRNGAGVFVTVQEMTGRNRKKEELAGVRAVFGEFDRGIPEQFPIEPTFTTNTSPGKGHAYWTIDAEDPVSAEDFSGIMMRLIESHGSDPDAKDLARVLRLAGTYHLKAEPYLVRVVSETGYRYSRADLLDAFPLPLRKPAASANVKRPRFIAGIGTAVELERFIAPLRSIPPTEYGVWVKIGMALHTESGGSDAGLQMWDTWSAGDKEAWAPGVCEDKWKSFKGRGVSGGTIFALAEQYGWTRGSKTTSSTYRKTSQRNDAGDNRPPDMSVINRNQVEVTPFPLGVFDESAAEWVVATAESKSAPVDYIALGLLVSASAIIGPKRRASPWDGWSEPSILWGALVGPPSVSKSPSMDPFRDGARQIERELNINWEQTKREYEVALEQAQAYPSVWEKSVAEAAKKGLPAPPMPQQAVLPKEVNRSRLWIVDCTSEMIARILADNPNGLLCFRDELSGLLGGFDKYGGSGSDRAFWLEAYGGRSYRYDRVSIKDEPIDIPFNAVSLLGGLQPDKLNSMVLSGDDDGLAARPLYAWPNQVRSRRPRPRDPNAPPLDAPLLTALRRLASMMFDAGDNDELRPRTIPLETEAANEFQSWWERIQWDAKMAATGRLAGAIGKLDGVCLRIAQTLEFLSWAWTVSNEEEPRQIGMRSLLNAIQIVEGWCKPNLARAFAEAALPEPQRDAMAVANWLLKNRPADGIVNARELRRAPGFTGPKGSKELDAALEVLIDARWLTPVVDHSAHRPRKDYAIDKRVYDSAGRKG